MPLSLEPPEVLQQKLFCNTRKFAFEINHLRLPNGSTGEWACVRHPGGAMAVPMMADGRFVLVKQYRFALQGRLLEFPAGTVEVDEDPFITIQREIQEETGYKAHRWQPLAEFPLAPGYSDEIIYAYLAQDLERLEAPPAQDEDEDIETVLMTAAEMETAIRQGEPMDAKTICTFFMARSLLQL